MVAIRFKTKDAVFFSTLRKKVDDYFKESGAKSTGNYKLYSKTIILFLSLVFFYTWVIFYTPESIFLTTIIAIIVGLILSAIGFNVMHDGSHGSYSKNKKVNNIMAHSMNLLGGNAVLWHHKHNVYHHTYTNIEGVDEDIDLKPLLRTNLYQKRLWIHRFQHIYLFILYGLTYIFMSFFRDFKKYAKGKIGDNMPMPRLTASEHFVFWISKIVHLILFLVIPMIVLGPVMGFVGYIITVFAAGLILAIVFQLAHIVENLIYVKSETNVTEVPDEWAVHQLKTTANFGTKSKLLGWWLGGLNFQVEHHLFPRVAHIHYPQISKIVKETCREFNVSYNEFPTMWSALLSHLRYMKYIGRA